MRHTGGELADGFHFLHLPELFFEIDALRDVLHVAMHHVAGHDGIKRPRKDARAGARLELQARLAGGEASLYDARGVGRQDGVRMFLAEHRSHFAGGIVEKSQFAFAGKFQHGIGIKFGERGELLDLRFGALALDRHRQQRRDGEEKMHLVFGNLVLLRRVDAQHAERPLMALDDDRRAAHDSMLHEQRRRGKTFFQIQIRHHHRFTGGDGVTGLRTVAGGNRRAAHDAMVPTDTPRGSKACVHSQSVRRWRNIRTARFARRASRPG